MRSRTSSSFRPAPYDLSLSFIPHANPFYFDLLSLFLFPPDISHAAENKILTILNQTGGYKDRLEG
jgi:hypothetical protein